MHIISLNFKLDSWVGLKESDHGNEKTDENVKE